jgi:hypothetical protein
VPNAQVVMGICSTKRVRKNKANLVRDQASGVRDLTPNPRPPKPWGGCTNKPNFRVTAGTAVVLMGKMPMLRNALRRHYEQGFCAKQTQFGPRQGEGQVVCGKGVMTERTCKEHWKNKANSRPGREWARAGTVDSAKRTQFGDIGRGGFGETMPIGGGWADARCPASAGARRPHRALGVGWECGCVAQPVG